MLATSGKFICRRRREGGRPLGCCRAPVLKPEQGKSKVMVAPRRLAVGRLASVFICLGLACGGSSPVEAGMSIEGSVDALQLEANGASLEDVLAGLGAKFNLHYHASAALDGSITGTYQGPLARVASRLLADYDFVIKRSDEHVEIFVFRRHGRDDTAVAANASPEDAAGGPSPASGIQPIATPGVQQTASSGGIRPRGRGR